MIDTLIIGPMVTMIIQVLGGHGNAHIPTVTMIIQILGGHGNAYLPTTPA